MTLDYSLFTANIINLCQSFSLSSPAKRQPGRTLLIPCLHLGSSFTPRGFYIQPPYSAILLFLYSIVSATFPYLSFPASFNHQYPVFNKERQKLVEEAPELSSTAPGTWNSQMLSSAHPLMLPIPPPALESWSFPLPRETFSEYPLSLIFCFLPGTSHQPRKMLKSLPCEKKTPLWAFLSHPSISSLP